MAKKIIEIKATNDGEVKKLQSLKDGVFSENVLGDGVVIYPGESLKKIKYFAPVSGKLTTVFKTGHAFGITTKEGVEVLLHIGLDTVELQGKGFKIAKVIQGQEIEVGTLLVTVKQKILHKKGKSGKGIVIITSKHKISSKKEGNVKSGDTIFEVKA